MKIPDEKDWQTIAPDDLDYQCAHNNFFGKNLEEARELFVDNALYYQEDLVWMPESPFLYYIHAYIDYLLSAASREDTDGASCFLGLIDIKFGWKEFDTIFRIKDDIRQTIEHIRQNPEWFDWDEDIYGDLNIQTLNLLETLNDLEKDRK